jgi:hypothetical protein
MQEYEETSDTFSGGAGLVVQARPDDGPTLVLVVRTCRAVQLVAGP